MRCLSTRGGAAVRITEAIERGLAPDGGLYVPERIPEITPDRPRDLAATAAAMLAPYFADEPIAASLPTMCAAAFDFPAPVVPLGGDDHLLELFHGPTAAFKDYGARFLAECMAREAVEHDRTVLVATSGDTGAAVAAAYFRRAGFRVVLLYPDGRVSPRQAYQLGAFGENVRALRVAGTFDDCQRLAKEAFSDDALRARHHLTSANSINLGRLLPQIAYYAQASRALGGPGPVHFVVPSGNLGNALACLIARAMGLPIGEVTLATNANRVLVDLVRQGRWAPAATIATLANAMDVGAPSNVERLRALFPSLESIAADCVSDDEIRATITRTFTATDRAICPHTACAVEVLRRQRAAGRKGIWVAVATAHPAKFASIVEPLIGVSVAPPPALAALLARPSHSDPLPPSLAALASALG
jgi:threonine synthase